MTDQEAVLIGSLTKELWEIEKEIEDRRRKAETLIDCMDKIIDALKHHKQCNVDDNGVLSFADPGSMTYYQACIYPEVDTICNTLNGINKLKERAGKIEAEMKRLKPR